MPLLREEGWRRNSGAGVVSTAAVVFGTAPFLTASVQKASNSAPTARFFQYSLTIS